MDDKTTEILLAICKLILKQDLNTDDEDKHLNIHCNSCKIEEFNSYRYKCLICVDYDLCSNCFENHKTSDDHLLCHTMIRYDLPNTVLGNKIENNDIDLEYIENLYKNKIHENSSCDGCLSKPLKGIRLKCSICYDYDLCLDCYLKKKESKTHSYYNHPMIVEDNNCLKLDSNQIEFIQKLGEGGFGAVYKSRIKSSGQIVACKKISIDKKVEMFRKLLGCDSMASNLIESFQRELEAYSELKYKNVIKMIGNWTEIDNDNLNMYIVTEFMDKNSLSNLLENEKLTFRRKLSISVDIITGMLHLHNRKYIHRDIRPDNILISSDYTAKIGDFGIAKIIDVNQKQSLIGCRPYMPPEFYTGKYDQKLDVYTFGLTLVELFEGEHKMNSKDPTITVTTEPKLFNKLIEKCVDTEPEKRPNSTEIYKYLKNIAKLINSIFNKFVKDYSTKSFEEKNKLFKDIYDKIIEKFDITI